MRSIKNGADSYQYNFFLKDIKTAERIIIYINKLIKCVILIHEFLIYKNFTEKLFIIPL